MLSQQDFDELRRLEESLWIAQTRFDKGYMEHILSSDFIEFGRSGKIYRREDTLAAAYDEISITLPLKNFTAHPLDAHIVLTTYISEVIDNGKLLIGNRSSIWLKTPTGWLLRFHQGTPVGGK